MGSGSISNSKGNAVGEGLDSLRTLAIIQKLHTQGVEIPSGLASCTGRRTSCLQATTTIGYDQSEASSTLLAD